MIKKMSRIFPHKQMFDFIAKLTRHFEIVFYIIMIIIITIMPRSNRLAAMIFMIQ